MGNLFTTNKTYDLLIKEFINRIKELNNRYKNLNMIIFGDLNIKRKDVMKKLGKEICLYECKIWKSDCEEEFQDPK